MLALILPAFPQLLVFSGSRNPGTLVRADGSISPPPTISQTQGMKKVSHSLILGPGSAPPPPPPTLSWHRTRGSVLLPLPSSSSPLGQLPWLPELHSPLPLGSWPHLPQLAVSSTGCSCPLPRDCCGTPSRVGACLAVAKFHIPSYFPFSFPGPAPSLAPGARGLPETV